MGFQMPMYMLEGALTSNRINGLPSPTKSEGFVSDGTVSPGLPLSSLDMGRDEGVGVLEKVLLLRLCEGLTYRDVELILGFYQTVPGANAMLEIKHLTRLLLLKPLTASLRSLLAAVCSVSLYASVTPVTPNPSLEAATYYAFATAYFQFTLQGLPQWELECFQITNSLIKFILDRLLL
ncbi:hypothetical protein L0F63_000429 [Massospora cicadina]|nr:hypothetical protein L0F63_000429 [Massospora cicadina]